MKKNFIIITITLLLVFFPNYVKADNSIKFNKDSINIAPGETKKIDVVVSSDDDFTNVNFDVITTSVYVNFNSITVSDAFTRSDGKAYKLVSAKPQKSGTAVATVTIKASDSAPLGTEGLIRITNASLGTNGDITLPIGQIKIKVSNEKDEESTYLSSISSNIVDIDFSKDVYEYSVEVDEDIKELDLTALAEDENAKVTISNQKLDKKTTTITITVQSESGNKSTYKIIVTKKENNVTKVSKEEPVKKVVTDNDDKSDNYGKGRWVAILIVLIIGLIADLIYIKREN